MKLGRSSQWLAEGKESRERQGESQGRLLPSPALLYLPCNQVLEATQLVLVLGVVPDVLFSEEGLGGQTDIGGFLFLWHGPHNPAVWHWARIPLERAGMRRFLLGQAIVRDH